MKRLLSFLLAIILLSSTFSYSEGLLPSLTDAYGVDMTSMAVFLEREPDEETSDEAGTVTQVFYQVSEYDFDGFNNYLEENGCSLADYSVSGNTVTETIERQGKEFRFTYDNESLLIMLIYPSDTNPENLNAELDVNNSPIYSNVSLIEQTGNQAAYINQDVQIGDIVELGCYEQDNNLNNGQERIEWLVLDIQEGNAFLISKDLLDCLPYHEHYEAITWEQCSLRQWLNNNFLNEAFTKKEQNSIRITNLAADPNPYFAAFQGNPTQDKIFLLSLTEYNKYFPAVSNKTCKATPYCNAAGNMGYYEWERQYIPKAVYQERHIVNSWWSRTSGENMFNACVDYPSRTDRDGATNVDRKWIAVRPALWVELNYLDSTSAKVTIAPADAPMISRYTDTSQDGATDLNSANIRDITVGDIVSFGHYEQDNNLKDGQESIEWQVLSLLDNEALLISNYVLDYQPFHKQHSFITWENSFLREWLNDVFLNNAFNEVEKQIIKEIRVPADKNPEYSSDPGMDTYDKVFLLSVDEAEHYFTSWESRKCPPTIYSEAKGAYAYSFDSFKSCHWRLRTPGLSQFYTASVGGSGIIDCEGEEVPSFDGVRPALWVDLTSLKGMQTAETGVWEKK